MPTTPPMSPVLEKLHNCSKTCDTVWTVIGIALLMVLGICIVGGLIDEGRHSRSITEQQLPHSLWGVQLENGSHRITLPGTFITFFGYGSLSYGRYRRYDEKEKALIYEDGESCGGGQLSSIIKLRCGPRAMLGRVAYPADCKREAIVEAPEFCAPHSPGLSDEELLKMLGDSTRSLIIESVHYRIVLPGPQANSGALFRVYDNGDRTNLGSFHLNDGKMISSGGNVCANQRIYHVDVNLVCGPDLALTSVQRATACLATATVAVPGLCEKKAMAKQPEKIVREELFKLLGGRQVEKTIGGRRYFLHLPSPGFHGSLYQLGEAWCGHFYPNGDAPRLAATYHGDRCIADTYRKTSVDLLCGDKFELIDVVEPSPCQYVAKVSVPGLCGPVPEVAQTNLKCDSPSFVRRNKADGTMEGWDVVCGK